MPTMKPAFVGAALAASLVALPSAAVILVPPVIREAAEDAPPKPAAPDVRANQINRCADARGRLVLQDAPCFPAPPGAAGSAADMRDLASLEPRPPVEATAATPEPAAGGFSGWLRNAWWKLLLLFGVAWGSMRVWQLVRENYLFRQYAQDHRDRPVTRR